MTKEKYFREVGKLLLQIKALADEFEGGCVFLSAYIQGDAISIFNDPNKENHYDFCFKEGEDIENGKITASRYFKDSNVYFIEK